MCFRFVLLFVSWSLLSHPAFAKPLPSPGTNIVSDLKARNAQWTDWISNIGSAIGSNIGSNLSPTIFSGIGSGIGSAVGNNIGSAIGSFYDSLLPMNWMGGGDERQPSSRPDLRPDPRPETPRGGGRKASLSIVTAQNQVYCRNYPDTISPDMSKVKVITLSGTPLDLKCWTTSAMPDYAGRVGGDGSWLLTNEGCYINQINVQDERDYDFRSELYPCPQKKHWVGVLADQYQTVQRKDCYTCTSLNCKSQNLNNGPFADLVCYTKGEAVLGNPTWFQSGEGACFLPSAVFNSTGFLGNPGSQC